MYVHVHVRARARVCVYVCVYMSLCKGICMGVCLCMCICVCTCIYALPCVKYMFSPLCFQYILLLNFIYYLDLAVIDVLIEQKLNKIQLILYPDEFGALVTFYHGKKSFLVFVVFHDDLIKWKHFPHYWLFLQGIHWSPVEFPHKGQLREALVFCLICAWTNGWVHN